MSPIHIGYLKCSNCCSAAEQIVHVGFVSDKKRKKKKKAHFPLVKKSN